VQFGLGDKDEASAERLKGSSSSSNAAPDDDQADRHVKIALQICVKQPAALANNMEDAVDYKSQQIQKVLLYHLRKYAAALNASLVFVADNNNNNKSEMDDMGDEADALHAEGEPAVETAASDAQQPTVTTAQLPLVWKALAQGKPVWKYASMEAVLDDKLMDEQQRSSASEPAAAVEDGEPAGEASSAPVDTSTTAAAEPVYSLIYGPDNHNTELIESVLQRNANYPGHWDVATDSIWKILPSTASDNKKDATAASTKSNASGDAAWLTELRESVKGNETVGMQTPQGKGSNNNTESTTKTPNDAAVSSFFEGLLS